MYSPTILICKFCRKKFTPHTKNKTLKGIKIYYHSPSLIQKINPQFCSLICSQKFTRPDKSLNVSISKKGKGNGRIGYIHNEETKRRISLGRRRLKVDKWDGYVTPQNVFERLRFLKTIHSEILKRDNYTCQLCGNKGGKLHVDHIQSWAEYIDLRFELNNCRTLCMSCHYFITFKKPMRQEVRHWGHK